MNRNICLLIETPLEKRDYDRFGIELLRKRGFNVAVLDLTEWLNPQYLKNYQPPDVVTYEAVVQIATIKAVESFFEKNSDIFCFDFIRLYPKTAPLYKVLKKYKVKYAAFYSNCIPLVPSVKQNIVQSVLRRIKGLTWERILSKLRYLYINANIESFQIPELVLLGGQESVQSIPRYMQDIEKLWVHSFDYDLYLKNKNSQEKGAGKYIVYLDEFYPFHPDLMIYELPIPFIDAPKYYEGLCRLFEDIEEKTGWPVVIAAHPRSTYEALPDYFKGRKCERFKTIELVRDSSGVIAHSSTAIGFAALFKKPILFCTNNELDQSMFGSLIANYAEEFGKELHNMDSALNIEYKSELAINEQIYNGYVAKYIKKPGTPEKYYWDIVAEKFLSLS